MIARVCTSVLGLVVAAAALRRDPGGRLADVHVYIGAARSLMAGRGLYSWAATNGDGFTYPPFAGLLAVPLTLVPEPELRGLWTAGVLLTVVAIAQLALRTPDLHALAARGWALPALVAVLLVTAPVLSTLRFGQVSVLVMLLALPACLRTGPGQVRAGVMLGIAAGIKLTPLALVPYLWLAGRRRAAAAALAAFAATVAAGWALLPADSATFWLHLGALTDRIGDPALSGNQSLHGLLTQAGTGEPARTGLWLLGCLVAVPALVHAARLYRGGRPLAGAALAGTVAVMCSPVSWTHHQLWLLGLAVLPLLPPRPVALQRAWVLTVVVVMCQPWSPARGVLALAAVGAAGVTARARA
jgi:alpha-1,2-mannosyltransferase